MSKTLKIILALLLVVNTTTLFISIKNPRGVSESAPSQKLGYSSGDALLLSTSTGAQTQFPNYRNAFRTDFRPGYGTTTPGLLGSVVITAKGTGRFCLHDATSTATNAEGSGTTTIACFGPNAAEGEYPFRIPVETGLLVEYLDAPTVGWASTTISGNRQ